MKKTNYQKRLSWFKFTTGLFAVTAVFACCMVAHNEIKYEDTIQAQKEMITHLSQELASANIRYKIKTEAKHIDEGERISRGQYDKYNIDNVEYLYNVTTGDSYYATETVERQIH